MNLKTVQMCAQKTYKCVRVRSVRRCIYSPPTPSCWQSLRWDLTTLQHIGGTDRRILWDNLMVSPTEATHCCMCLLLTSLSPGRWKEPHDPTTYVRLHEDLSHRIDPYTFGLVICGRAYTKTKTVSITDTILLLMTNTLYFLKSLQIWDMLQ